MFEEIKKFITEKETGLYLLESPTGFGKTTAVLDYIEKFITSEIKNSKKRIFFVTNLKTNLPWKELKTKIGKEMFDKNCLVLESFADTIMRQWGEININYSPVRISQEYAALNEDNVLLKSIRDELENPETSLEDKKKKKVLQKHLISKIQEKSEPQFREMIKKNYFYGKSVVEKKKFINNHLWFRNLYPSSIIENFKVIFLTTAKFINPIDSFYRMPFMLADDTLLKDSIVFIDEFDATKETMLSHIIKQDLKVQVDLVKLFLNIYYSVDNLSLPKRMLKVSDYLQACIDCGRDYKTPEQLVNGIKDEFKQKYEQYKFKLAIKSEGLDKSKTFLYYDGKSFTITKDNSRKNIYVKEDTLINSNKIYSASRKNVDGIQLKNIIEDINYSINYFIRGLVYLSANFKNVKNQSLEKNDPKYSIEESIMSMLSVFNISNEFSNIIFQMAINFYHGRDLKFKNETNESYFMRKGFNFTEVEDDTYHDLQSKFHAFYFRRTPEDIIYSMSNNANIIGISATASLETVVGNYDIKYLREVLNDKYYPCSPEGKKRIDTSFSKQLEIYDKENIDIRVIPVDDFSCFSNEEKLLHIINNNLGLKEETKTILINKYYQYINEEKKENIDKNIETKKYYQFIKYKLAYCYKYFISDDSIKSFLCFNNFSIKSNSNVKEKELLELFEFICKDNNKPFVKPTFITAGNFSEEFLYAKNILKEGEKVFWVTTYKTIGSGKNIQYEIPKSVSDNIILDGDRNDKDFDAIYLCTPTNLVQNLSFNSVTKYEDLAKYLFQQEYLRQRGYLHYQYMKQNVIRGFKKIFYNIEDIYYSHNGDLLLHSGQIIIQALGRICRCRNKNKTIHILSDVEVIDRLQKIEEVFENKIYNKEFQALLSTKISHNNMKLSEFSKQNKFARSNITSKGWCVRNSEENVRKWIDIRDYALKNPTANFVREEFRNYYFELAEKYSGYCYHLDKYKNFDSLNFINKFEEAQVSDAYCGLAALLEIPEVYEEFEKNNYAMKFEKCNFVMTPSFFKQVYLGALGEVVGKIIIEKEVGYDVQEIEDYTKYELFDFRIGNVYFDFKHWDEFVTDHNKYCDKIRRKLNRVKGDKCFIINLTAKKSTEYMCQNLRDEIFIVPFLIDPNTGEISAENIEFINENM